MQTLKIMAALALASSAAACGSALEDGARKLNPFLQGSGTSGKLLPETPEQPLDAEAVAMTLPVDLRGAISQQDGSQGLVLQGWVVMMTEWGRVGARTGTIDAAGLFTLQHVQSPRRGGGGKTLSLLSPDYQLQGVLSLPSEVPNAVRQYFTPETAELPQLINKGPILAFQSLSGVHVEHGLASDQNSDGVPDGGVSVGAMPISMNLVQMPSSAAVDIDLDGAPNELDPDIDGDGIANALDPDDNGNGVFDAFDADANGNYIRDEVDAFGQQIYDRARFDVSYVHGADGASEVRFRLEMRGSAPRPEAVTIQGAPSLLNNSWYEALDEAGQPVQVAFNRRLEDDGLSCDGAAQDGVYGRCVHLEKRPRANEVVLAQLVHGPLDTPWLEAFPYTFPDVKTHDVSLQFDPSTRTVLFVGNPFGNVQDFTWDTSCYDAFGRLQWTSAEVMGTKRTDQIPERVGCTSLRVSARSGGSQSAFPAFIVLSRLYDLD